MSDPKRQREDLSTVARVLATYQKTGAHGEVLLTIQDGCLVEAKPAYKIRGNNPEAGFRAAEQVSGADDG